MGRYRDVANGSRIRPSAGGPRTRCADDCCDICAPMRTCLSVVSNVVGRDIEVTLADITEGGGVCTGSNCENLNGDWVFSSADWADTVIGPPGHKCRVTKNLTVGGGICGVFTQLELLIGLRLLTQELELYVLVNPINLDFQKVFAAGTETEDAIAALCNGEDISLPIVQTGNCTTATEALLRAL